MLNMWNNFLEHILTQKKITQIVMKAQTTNQPTKWRQPPSPSLTLQTQNSFSLKIKCMLLKISKQYDMCSSIYFEIVWEFLQKTHKHTQARTHAEEITAENMQHYWYAGYNMLLMYWNVCFLFFILMQKIYSLFQKNKLQLKMT